MRRFYAVFGILSACLLSSIQITSAQTLYYWTGNAGGGLWSTAGNWNTGTQGGPAAIVSPGNLATDSATINLGSSSGSPVTLNNNVTTTIGSLLLANAASSTAYLTVSGAGTLLYANIGAAGYNVAGNTGATAGLSLESGGSLTLNGTGQVVLASAANTTANLTVGSGSTFTTTTTSAFRVGNNTGANATVTVDAGGTVSIAAQMNVGNAAGSTGSVILNGGALTATTTLIGAAGTGSLSISAGSSMTAGQTSIGSTATGTLSMSGGSMGISLLTVGTGTNGNGTATITGGTVTSTGGATVAASGATAGSLRVKGTGQVLLNSGNTSSVILTIGQNAASGSAGTLLLEGGTVAPAAGATNGFGVSLYTPGTLTSTTTTSTIQGYGTLSLGGTGSKSFLNGGKVIASGANLVSGVGSATDQTLALNGSTFTVGAIPANRAAGSGWYAVDHGQLAMNMSGTASGTTLNWGAPSGAFSSSSLVNSAQLTLSASTAPSAITISLLATDRTDMASVLSRGGLPAGTLIGLWNIANGSANTWTGLTLRYDDVLAASQTPSLYYTPTASGTWSLVTTTVDLGNFLVSDNVASLNTGYYALSVVPEPGVVSLILAGGIGLVLARRIRRRAD